MSDFSDAAALISSLYKGEKNFADVISDIQRGKIAATPALSDQLWVTSSVLGSEENPLIKQWTDLQSEVQLKQLGVTATHAVTTTQEYGPRYNRLDERGYLVPASLDPDSIPKDGDAAFGGLCAKPTGEIDFFFENRPGKPPMIFGEDIDLALIFAFHPSNQKLPWLSLEGLDENFPDRPRWLFTQKQWDPLWIGRTLMGQTLYAADFWVGQLAWRSKSFPVSPTDIPDQRKRERVIALLKDFELCGGAADGHSSRVMLKPGDVHGTWNKTKAGDIVCDIHSIDMGVDGSDIAIKVDPATNKMVEDRLLNLNDPKFAMGRVALLLTQRYNEIAEFFPMFERGRQLIGLLKTLVTLKEKYNFKPSAQLAARIDKAYRYHTGKPALTLQQRLCAPLSLGD